MLARIFCVLAFIFALALGQDEVSVFKKANPLQNQKTEQNLKNSSPSTVPQNTQISQDLKNSAPQNQQSTQNSQNTQNSKNSNDYKNKINQETIKAIAGSDEPDANAGEIYETSNAVSAVLNAELKTKEAFLFEPFLIEIKVVSDVLSSLHPSVMVDSSGIKLLNPKAKFVSINKKESLVQLWFVATNQSANIKEIAVVLKRGDELVFRDGLKPHLPNIKELVPNDDFSNVVAKNLALKSFKASKFDEFSNLVNIELEATNGNLSEFKIPISNAKSGVENLKGGVEKMSANYFLIAPNSVQNISFCYYNTATGSYEYIDVPIRPTSSELSTQTNLNPSESEFAKYKAITIYALIILALFGFMLWRSFYCLVIAIILGVYALYDARPFSQITIKSGAEVTILPTSGSSVFHKSANDESVKVLGKSGQYTKIMLENQKIGWIRNENIK